MAPFAPRLALALVVLAVSDAPAVAQDQAPPPPVVAKPAHPAQPCRLLPQPKSRAHADVPPGQMLVVAIPATTCNTPPPARQRR